MKPDPVLSGSVHQTLPFTSLGVQHDHPWIPKDVTVTRITPFNLTGVGGMPQKDWKPKALTWPSNFPDSDSIKHSQNSKEPQDDFQEQPQNLCYLLRVFRWSLDVVNEKQKDRREEWRYCNNLLSFIYNTDAWLYSFLIRPLFPPGKLLWILGCETHSDSSVQHLSWWWRILCSGRFALWISNLMVCAGGQGVVHRRSTGLKYFVSGCFLDYPGYEVIVMVVFYTFTTSWRDLVLRWRHPGVFNRFKYISAWDNCAAAWGIVLKHYIIKKKK